MTTIHKMRRSELIQAIEDYGENPPAKWTMPELRTRLALLREEHGWDGNKQEVTDLRKWVIQLNLASKKKGHLQDFCQKIGVHMTKNETILQLQKMAMIKIYEISTPHMSDPVGFGKAASLTYEEVSHDADYCQWVVKTWEEGSTCPQLSRLAKWLQSDKKDTTNQQEDAPMKVKEPPVTQAKSKSKPKKSAETQSVSSNASSQAILEAMNVMMGALQELKSDVADLQNQRPRKKAETESSFSVVSHQEP